MRSWLVLPQDTAPAPLLSWIHGGPLGSQNSWSWRQNPWLLAAVGYAVLLPDPALSTGYGEEFIQCGWGAWGGPPFEDLMAATDATCAHPRIDTTPHRFLYFPSEDHWVEAPQHTKIWYQVVIASLAQHVLGESAELPEMLGVPSRL